MNTDLRKGQVVYLAKHTRPYARGIGVVKGAEFKVVDTYDFKDAVRVRDSAGTESIVTRAELATMNDIARMEEELRAEKEANRE